MEKNTKLQIPISQKLKKTLEKRSSELGFSSVNETVRVLLQNFAVGNINIGITQGSTHYPLINLETEKRISESYDDIKKGHYTKINKTTLKNWLDSL